MARVYTQLTACSADRRLAAYSDDTIVLTLPKGLSFVDDVKYVSMYCILYTANFGDIRIPEALNVPEFQGELN